MARGLCSKLGAVVVISSRTTVGLLNLCPSCPATMSRSAYPLEAPRPRQPPPPPLTFSPSAFDFDSSISFRGTGKDTHTLLYDVPSSISMTSPTSPRSRHSRVLSPTSPTFTGRQINSGRPTPPPSARNRSTTPSAISSTDLEKFGDLCKQWYSFFGFDLMHFCINIIF